MKELKWSYSEISQQYHVSNNDAYFTIPSADRKAPFILRDAGREVATFINLNSAKQVAHIIYNDTP